MKYLLFVATRPRVIKALGMLVLFCCITIGMAAVDVGSTLRVYARTEGFHIVVDAGHGGKDKGASSINGTYESDINLAIALALKQELTAHGIGVTMTRETKDWLAAPMAKNKKKSDLEKRKKIIEDVKPDLIISIHLNTFPSDSSVRGLQTFYDKDGTTSKVYAEAIQDEFNKSPLNINRKAKIGDYYVLDSTAYPSVLVECGFLSNPDDERLLNTTEYQRIIAHYIASAVASVQIKQAVAKAN